MSNPLPVRVRSSSHPQCAVLGYGSVAALGHAASDSARGFYLANTKNAGGVPVSALGAAGFGMTGWSPRQHEQQLEEHSCVLFVSLS